MIESDARHFGYDRVVFGRVVEGTKYKQGRSSVTE
jgi:hypothetical protein